MKLCALSRSTSKCKICTIIFCLKDVCEFLLYRSLYNEQMKIINQNVYMVKIFIFKSKIKFSSSCINLLNLLLYSYILNTINKLIYTSFVSNMCSIYL